MWAADTIAEESSSADDQVSSELSTDDRGLASAENSLVLTLAFSETSWVDIRNDKDERLAYKSYVQGEDLTVESNSNLSVFIGNAAGVTVQLNGENFDLEPHKEGVYAKFVIER